MVKLLNWTRLPVFLLGVALMFVAEHLVAEERYHLVWRGVALGLVGLGVLCTWLLALQASRQGHRDEARGWRLLSLWQLTVAAALGLYCAYAKALGSAPAPETPVTKVLLAAWLLLLILGVAAGIGAEWAARGAGRGDLAEPQRISRSQMAWLAVGMLFSVLICFNYVGNKKDIQRDFSYLKVRSPSEVTAKMLKTLTEPLHIVGFYPQGNEVQTALSDYFSAIAALDPHVKVEWYDKDMAPTKAETLKVPRNGQIVLDLHGKQARIESGVQLSKAKRTLKDLDNEFQKALLEVAATRKTLYFTRGHGEFSWIGDAGDSPLRSLRLLEAYLRQQGYNTRFLGANEGSTSAVPDDAGAVIVAGPTEAFSKEETEVLRTYAEGGGNLLVFMGLAKSTTKVDVANAAKAAAPEAEAPGGPFLAQLLADIGLKYEATPLANETKHVAATRSPADVWFIFSNIFTSHESVTTLARHDERVAMFLYQSGYWTLTPETAKWKTFETVRSLADTFADKNRNFKYDPDEKRSQFIIGAVAQLKDDKKGADPHAPKKAGAKQGRVVAFADAPVISDALITAPGNANAQYFVDSLKWALGDTELQGQLANDEDVKIRHTRKEDMVWFHGTVVVVPLLVLGAGFLATRRRRGEEQKSSSGGQTHAA